MFNAILLSAIFVSMMSSMTDYSFLSSLFLLNLLFPPNAPVLVATPPFAPTLPFPLFFLPTTYFLGFICFIFYLSCIILLILLEVIYLIVYLIEFSLQLAPLPSSIWWHNLTKNLVKLCTLKLLYFLSFVS